MSESKYKVGDRVKVKKGMEHEGMGDMSTGEIKEISTPALGIQFDDMEGIHKWYVDAEVEPAKEEKPNDKKNPSKGKGDKMDMATQEPPAHFKWFIKSGEAPKRVAVQERRLKVLHLASGEVTYEKLSSMCTFAQYIAGIAKMNMSAHIQGVVYMPDEECKEYVEFVG